MKVSLQQQIYFFTLSCCLLFIVLVFSILWSSQVVELALKREQYANKVEHQSNILKQFILSENIYASDYNTDNWLVLDSNFKQLLRQAPSLTPPQQTIQNSINNQRKNIVRLFDAINKNKLKNANGIIKKHLKIRLITQLEAIRTDSVQLFTNAKKDIETIVRHQVSFILFTLSLVIITLIYGAFRLIKIFKTSLKEVKIAFEKNHSGYFQTIHLSNKSEEFESIAIAFNAMNKKLSETTVSLEAMKKIVAEKVKVLEEISNTDPLTKVANRRALFEYGNAEFARVKRTQGQLAVVLLDCDFFKNINDEFGHLFGDEVLKNLSRICTQEIRSCDFFARYGGEEFVIILPGSGLDGAVETAKRIQRSLANHCIEFEGKEVCVTISIGICSVNEQHHSFEELIKDADKAMYKAKENGRNKIEIIK